MGDAMTRERAVRAALENLRRESRYISGVCHSAVQERHVFDGVALTRALAALDRAAAAEATVRELRALCDEAACAVHASNPMRPDLYARLRAAAAAHPASEGVAK